MRKNKFLIILCISLVIYSLTEYLYENAILYLMGGTIGYLMKQFFKLIGIAINDSLFYFVWIALLIGNVYLYFRLQLKPLKFLVLIVISGLFYVIDFLLFSIIKIETIEIQLIYFILGLRIISKSLLLSMVVFWGMNNYKKALNSTPSIF